MTLTLSLKAASNNSLVPLLDLNKQLIKRELFTYKFVKISEKCQVQTYDDFTIVLLEEKKQNFSFKFYKSLYGCHSSFCWQSLYYFFIISMIN